ncbi:MAG TPA: hypothetical protein VEZ11_13080 [Thermoanaerobaculia bacterium]|nr:hypothetical protein [Thermoanaerobaculia bacterium]
MLDETADVVRIAAAPWAGVLILTSLPWLFLQVLFFNRLLELGDEATHYGNALLSTAYAVCFAFILAILGRAIYARACRFAAATGTTPGKEAFRVPPVALSSYFFTATLVELLFMIMTLTFAGIPLAIMVGGLAIGTMELNDRAGIRPPLRLIVRYARNARLLSALFFIFTLAFGIAWINLIAAFSAGLWLASAFGGLEVAQWSVLLSPSNRLFVLLTAAGAAAVIEPFWIAANVILVRKAGTEESGEELKLWFRELQAEKAR